MKFSVASESNDSSVIYSLRCKESQSSRPTDFQADKYTFLLPISLIIANLIKHSENPRSWTP